MGKAPERGPAGQLEDKIESVDDNHPIYIDQNEWEERTAGSRQVNTPENSSGNSIQPVVLSLLEGLGAQKLAPPTELKDPKLKPELSPDDPEYQSGLTAVFDAISDLPDCPHKTSLLRLTQACGKLPSGEVDRFSDTVEKRTERWPDTIPKSAPELFRDRKASEKLPDFLRRVYGEAGYLKGEMTTAHIEILDPPCASAIRSWVNKHGELPEDINLPGKISRPKGLKYNK